MEEEADEEIAAEEEKDETEVPMSTEDVSACRVFPAAV